MSGDLQGLHDLFENNLDSIPPLVLEELQLKKIVEHWNQPKDDGNVPFRPSFSSSFVVDFLPW